jgi:putative xylitol transport system ATP-binding protein
MSAANKDIPLLLEASDVHKSFGGVVALSDGQFRLKAGSVHALCGGNGAGKSTFLNIVMGILQRDAGTVLRNGRPVHFESPGDALDNGISIVEQELSPVPFMTVAENIFLGREPLRAFGRVDFRKMNSEAKILLDKLGFDIAPTDRMMDLPVAKIQLVEIAKALSYNAEIIIMDEPTSALGEAEAEQLFDAISLLKAQGKGVIYVSHRLSEILEIADQYTVFRDGRFIADGETAAITKEDLIHLIVGRTLDDGFPKTNIPTDRVRLSVKGINSDNHVRDVTFDLHEGEVLALYGLMGSGRTEVLDRLFGLTRCRAGQITLDGEPFDPNSPAMAIGKGLAFVTEDRKASGLVLSGSVRDNICLASLPMLSSLTRMKPGVETTASGRMIDLFGIKAATTKMPVSGLSGGNQQKVVLAKWFLTEPGILLLDEPTRGVDVGAKSEIYRIISSFAADGGSVLMISSETDEVLGLADRALVMRDGRLMGELSRSEMSAKSLLHLAA